MRASLGLFLAALLSLTACGGVPDMSSGAARMGSSQVVRAPEDACDDWNKAGCLHLRFVSASLSATEAHARTLPLDRAMDTPHYLQGIIDGRLAGFEAAAAIYNLSRGASPDIRLVRGCSSWLAYSWFSDQSQAHRIRTFRGDRPGKVRKPEPLAVAEVPPGMTAPSTVFGIEVCEGEGALNVPLDFIRPPANVPDAQVVMIICERYVAADGLALYPKSGVRNGIHITAGMVRKRLAEIARGEAKPIGVIPIVRR